MLDKQPEMKNTDIWLKKHLFRQSNFFFCYKAYIKCSLPEYFYFSAYTASVFWNLSHIKKFQI